MKINKIVMIVTVSVFVLLSGGLYYLNYAGQQGQSKIVSELSQEEETERQEKGEQSTQKVATEKNSNSIFVHVCGAVKKPGVYELQSEARVCDAIKAAGGLKKKAADTEVNQAQTLTDGEQVCIPYKTDNNKESVVADGSGMSSGTEGNKISINRATAEELMTLPGIGESKAQSIIQYREEHGGFQKIEDIKNIQGIKDGVFNKIVDCIVL